MNLRHLAIPLLLLPPLLLNATGAASPDASTPPSPAILIRQVVANELADRTEPEKWIYRVNRRQAGQTLTAEQVDTQDGPLYRLLAIDGAPLNPAQRRQDDNRIASLLHNPSEQSRSRLEHEEDEQKLQKLLRLMPDAFLYDYAGTEGNLVRLTFRGNPSYTPPTYEARVVQSLAGAILIDPQQKRLAKISGTLISRVDFGYGFLGHIDQGGTIEIGRVQVSPNRWKTALVNVQLSGRLAFFKTINKQHYETRSSFRALASDPTLAEALQLLAH
jgi:hypothetical protein